MATAYEISMFLNDLLNLKAFSGDASNNGLQFDAGTEVKRAVFGVDACKDLFDFAAEDGADFIFVHHGLSWGGSLKRIGSLDAARITQLARDNMSLYAAHLPLDAHPEIGHNAAIAQMMGLKNIRPFGFYDGAQIGFVGDLPRKVKAKKLGMDFCTNLPYPGYSYTCFNDDKTVKTVAVVSGGGACVPFFQEMIAGKVDCLLTGEFTHQAWHYAKEADVAVVAAGHYRTEIPGVLNVMNIVAEEFGIECAFRELPTGL